MTPPLRVLPPTTLPAGIQEWRLLLKFQSFQPSFQSFSPRSSMPEPRSERLQGKQIELLQSLSFTVQVRYTPQYYTSIYKGTLLRPREDAHKTLLFIPSFQRKPPLIGHHFKSRVVYCNLSKDLILGILTDHDMCNLRWLDTDRWPLNEEQNRIIRESARMIHFWWKRHGLLTKRKHWGGNIAKATLCPPVLPRQHWCARVDTRKWFWCFSGKLWRCAGQKHCLPQMLPM